MSQIRTNRRTIRITHTIQSTNTQRSANEFVPVIVFLDADEDLLNQIELVRYRFYNVSTIQEITRNDPLYNFEVMFYLPRSISIEVHIFFRNNIHSTKRIPYDITLDRENYEEISIYD